MLSKAKCNGIPMNIGAKSRRLSGKTLKYVGLVILLLMMLLLGCQIGKNIMVTRTSASYSDKDAKNPTVMLKRIDDFIADVDQKGSVDVARLKDLLVVMREFISEYANKNNSNYLAE